MREIGVWCRRIPKPFPGDANVSSDVAVCRDHEFVEPENTGKKIALSWR
jgi:hypothetical protein